MKILIVCAKLNIGGLQAVAASISKYSKTNDEYHYIVFGEAVGEYEQEIIDNGHQVFHWESPSDNIFKYYISLVKKIKTEKYDVVHCHTSFNCGVVMLAAACSGVPCRISHSHCTSDDCIDSIYRKVYRLIMRLFIRVFSNEYLACGKEAGHYLYGVKWFEKHGVIIPNGLEFEKYKYSEDNRIEIRKSNGLDSKYVIGHTGHYEQVKNQEFIIRMMPDILNLKPNAVLLLYGEGSLRPYYEKLILDLQLNNSVFLMGNHRDIHKVLSAMDVFVFPSLSEGTPLSLIEAQANELPCVISDNIPYDACVLNDKIIRLSLNESEYTWIGHILNAERHFCNDHFRKMNNKYNNIIESMKKIYKIYDKHLGK